MSFLLKEGFKPHPIELAGRRRDISFLAKQARSELGTRHISVYDKRDSFVGLSIDELESLGYAMCSIRNVFEGYDLLAGSPRDRQDTYYDRVIGPQHIRAHQVLKKTIEEYEPVRVEKALDVGIGTGKSALTLASTAQVIVGIDAQESLLKVCRKRLKKLVDRRHIIGFEAIRMDAMEMDFPDCEFDIVIDNGLVPYLTSDELEEYRKNTLLKLKPGGRYYSYFAWSEDAECYGTTFRAGLAGEVVATLLSFSKINDHVYNPPSAAPQRFGYEGGNIVVKGREYFEMVLRWTKP